MKHDPVLVAVLRSVGARPADPGFSRPEVPGVSREQIDAAVAELQRGAYVVAAHVPNPFGEPPGSHWEPSELTAQGRHLLEELNGGA